MQLAQRNLKSGYEKLAVEREKGYQELSREGQTSLKRKHEELTAEQEELHPCFNAKQVDTAKGVVEKEFDESLTLTLDKRDLLR